MPLLHKKQFQLKPPPKDLLQNEEVFVCPATKEIFRDYEGFFNRHFLCESLVWTCEMTGVSNLTYTQAVDCEREAQKQLDSLDACYQKAALSLVHHTRRTNLKTLCEEIISFFKYRFIEGETVDHVVFRDKAREVTSVKIMEVIQPLPSVAEPTTKSPSDTLTPTTHTSLTNGVNGEANGSITPPNKPTDPESDPSGVCEEPKLAVKSPKTPRTPLAPLSSELSLNPADYRYVVKGVNNPELVTEVSGSQLVRPKSQFTTAKLKLLLKRVLNRKTERHPFAVKEDYVDKFNLGVSTVDFSLPTPSQSSRKRSLSQSQISSFFSPGDASQSEGTVKKPRTPSLKTPNKNGAKKKRKSVSSKKTPKSGKKTKSPSKSLGRTPSSKLKLAKTPSGSKEALKLLNKAKAKKLKQLDLKSSLIHKDTKKPLTLEELNALRKRIDEEKLRKKEERLRKLREKLEQKRKERLIQEAWQKPREDTLCEDSLALPSSAVVRTELSPELFPEAVMLLEFLNTFGPLFNIREVITGNITFEKIEFALSTHEIDSLLFDVIKFLLQALFATMEEEHEGKVNTKVATARNRSSSTPHDNTEPDIESRPEPLDTSEQQPSPPHSRHSRSNSRDEPSDLVEDDVMEEDKDDSEIKSLDTRVQKIKASAAKSALWSFSTQRVKLKELTLDPYTCTEVLRLHLVSSGGYSDTEGQKKYRLFRRGGYSDSDDPAVDLRLRRPEVVESLGEVSIYALPAKDKIEIISTLCLQLLTYVDSRELMDENMSRMKSIRKRIRVIGFNEERRKREEKSAQFKEKKAAKQKKDSAKVENEKSDGPPSEQDPPVDQPPPASPEDKETEEERKERIARELSELHQELSEATACVYLRPIGMDRNYSKYWIFPNLPGLYVETKVESSSTETPDQDKNTSGEGGLDANPSTGIDGQQEVAPDMTPPITPPTDSATPLVNNGLTVQSSNWHCLSSLEELDALLASLNPRGLREVALKKAIQNRRQHLEDTIHKCPFKSSRSSGLSKAVINNADHYLELYLREQILDIEDKIVVGNLGYLKVEENRVEWRDVIENSGAAAILGSQAEAVESSTELPQYSISDNVAELSKALLQVYKGIDPKFLMPPLGTAVDVKKTTKSKKVDIVKEGDLCPEQWKQSLSTVTSFSQIFVHLATLERAVMWSRSLLHVRCRICRRKCGDEYLLLCDGCDNGYHTYCLKPPLKTIPEGNWYCNYCAPVTPVKQRRGRPKLVVIEESSESESEEEDSAVVESELEEESIETDEEDEEDIGQRMTRSRVASVLATRGRKRPAQTRGPTKRGRKPNALSRKKAKVALKKQKAAPKAPEQPKGKGARKKLSMSQEIALSKAETLMGSILELKCSRGTKTHGSASRREQKSLEMQLCQALWEELIDQEESSYFEAPVKKREYPNYHEVITKPMDLHTVKLNIKSGKYDSLNDFVEDVHLIFSNCIKFHKRHSLIGKAGVLLRDSFDGRCSELGLSDLGLMAETMKGQTTSKQRLSRRK